MVELAIGFFDFVHGGHRKLLGEMRRRAAEKGAKSVAYTFRNHPKSVFDAEHAPKLLLSTEERRAVLDALVDEVIMPEFTSETANESAEEFAARLRREFPDLDTIFCGANWTFGKGGEGNAQFLTDRGFDVNVVPFVTYGNDVVSSTMIRRLLSIGDFPVLTRMGELYVRSGKVVEGKRLGRTLGIPTVNLDFGDFPLPMPAGVYAVESPRFGRAVANWGTAPTMGDRAWKKPILEVHFMDRGVEVNVDCGEKLSIGFVGFIRTEIKFPTEAEMVGQIKNDILRAKIILG